jgi:hypothetical protein
MYVEGFRVDFVDEILEFTAAMRTMWDSEQQLHDTLNALEALNAKLRAEGGIANPYRSRAILQSEVEKFNMEGALFDALAAGSHIDEVNTAMPLRLIPKCIRASWQIATPF